MTIPNLITRLWHRRQSAIEFHKNKKLTLSELTESTENSTFGFSEEAMATIIACKQARRSAKGLEFNCFILSNYDNLDNFINLFSLLKEPNFPDTRFQIIYRPPSSFHWAVADIKMKGGKLEIYFLDAAPNPLPDNIKKIIRSECPGALIRYSYGGIQHDPDNCATFALDHAYRLAKIHDLHEQLQTIEVLQSYKCRHQIKDRLPKSNLHPVEIFLTDCPSKSNLGPLVRNMQSLTTLESDFFKKELLGNDRQSLEEYVMNRVTNRKNTAIILKRENIKRKAKKFLTPLDKQGYEKIQGDRTGTNWCRSRLGETLTNPLIDKDAVHPSTDADTIYGMRQDANKRLNENRNRSNHSSNRHSWTQQIQRSIAAMLPCLPRPR